MFLLYHFRYINYLILQSSPLTSPAIEVLSESMEPTTPNTTMPQWKYFFYGVIEVSKCLLYIKGGKMKATVPAASAPIMSRKVVKSGIIRAIPVTIMITRDLMITDLTFCIFYDPTLK